MVAVRELSNAVKNVVVVALVIEALVAKKLVDVELVIVPLVVLIDGRVRLVIERLVMVAEVKVALATFKLFPLIVLPARFPVTVRLDAVVEAKVEEPVTARLTVLVVDALVVDASNVVN
jgi:hypothetical protein